jgi:hypothetical protein
MSEPQQPQQPQQPAPETQWFWYPPEIDMDKRRLSKAALDNVTAFFNRFSRDDKKEQGS